VRSDLCTPSLTVFHFAEHHTYFAVKKLVLWWEPAKSGAVLGGATFAYVVFERSGYTILTLCAHIALSSVLALALWTQFAAFVPERYRTSSCSACLCRQYSGGTGLRFATPV